MRAFSFLMALLIVMAALALPVGAQEAATLSSMEFSVWPEHDRPGALVIYRGEFSPAVSLPANVALTIPGSAGKPSATACIDDQGQYRYFSYTPTAAGDDVLVSYDCQYRRWLV